ncbi:asparaginase [Oxalobacteraceae bacterium R-40]|uniref:Asparaginase n=1 Tax=Keguizhuia sedimenti TaxID=3064264 RepID=A0ABU1BJ68_9BURK|nr:asparaginase [Oxalobacteraceae bacterium R-40]
MRPLALAEVTRGDFVESIHMGCVAVVNAQGELLYCAGDPHFWTFTRSTLKPFQAIPFVHAGGAAHFGFAAPELALMCASHSGEPVHADIVQSMLQKAGCHEQDLQCGCHIPIALSTADMHASCEMTFSQLHNNCSGKHAGFLAYCRQHGLDLRTYLDPQHPLQQAVRESVAHFSSVSGSSLRMGIDGCSAPNYAVPLSRLALAYARFAQGAPDLHYGDAPRILFDAMAAYPELVSGNGRADLKLSKIGRGDWVSKAGAEGVQAIGVRSAGLGIAIKITDGNSRALAAVAMTVLRQLGLLRASGDASLADLAEPSVFNCNGRVVGKVRSAFKLKPSSERLHKPMPSR